MLYGCGRAGRAAGQVWSANTLAHGRSPFVFEAKQMKKRQQEGGLNVEEFLARVQIVSKAALRDAGMSSLGTQIYSYSVRCNGFCGEADTLRTIYGR